jgi:CHASE3 domain sensor protein
MSQKELSAQERAARGKRLLIYGMFALVLVTMLTLFLVLWLWFAPLGQPAFALKWTLIVGAVAIVACVIVWFVYTKVILKE